MGIIHGVKGTTDSFIESAMIVHGDRYDYGMVDYKGANEKVEIICREHGSFWQTPSKHITSKRGCWKCGGTHRSNKEEFIKKAKALHGSKYDYSNVVYVNNKKNVIIVCSEHGAFEQKPDKHLSGHGCPKCPKKRISLTTDEFIRKSRIKHGDKYDYSYVEYFNNYIKVKIKCPIHGLFEQSPTAHMRGSGCNLCGFVSSSKKNSSNANEFIEKARLVHGDRYDYSNVKYNTNSDKVTIICKKHGEFKQTPNIHLNGFGCRKCRNSKLENLVLRYADKRGMHIEAEKRFDEIRNNRSLPFDFYMKDYNTVVECHGKHHFSAVDTFGGEDNTVLTKRNDLIKFKGCEKLGINYLVLVDKGTEVYIQNDYYAKYFTNVDCLLDYIENFKK